MWVRAQYCMECMQSAFLGFDVALGDERMEVGSRLIGRCGTQNVLGQSIIASPPISPSADAITH